MSYACVRVANPGLGTVTYADSDLSLTDDRWVCRRGDTVVDTARALDYIEQELFKLAAPELPLP